LQTRFFSIEDSFLSAGSKKNRQNGGFANLILLNHTKPFLPKQSTIQQRRLAYLQTSCIHQQRHQLSLDRERSYHNAVQQRA
jgi:hypothetical protein